jgi:hypothetical protein
MTEKTTTERRSRQRMPVRFPVKVRHEGGEHQGLTRDLSSSGIFLYSESGMKAGSKLELVIMLPPGLGLGPGGWTLCEASVVRVEESEGKGMGDQLRAGGSCSMSGRHLKPFSQVDPGSVNSLFLKIKRLLPNARTWCNNCPL